MACITRWLILVQNDLFIQIHLAGSIHPHVMLTSLKIAQDAFAFQLKQLLDRLNFLDGQIEYLDHELLSYYEKFDCYLHTIPGIGMIAAATTCSFHNSPLNAYYKKKREQGKHHLTATSGVIKFENLKMSITTKPPTGRLNS